MENNELTAEALRRSIRRIQAEQVKITLNGIPCPIGVEYNFYAEAHSTFHRWIPEYVLAPSAHHIVTASRGTPPDEIAAISILHELGHVHQWMTGYMTIDKHYATRTENGLPRKGQIVMEEDAWMRAFDLADEIGFSPSDETLDYAQRCFATYVDHWKYTGELP